MTRKFQRAGDRDVIRDSGQIRGARTLEEAQDLAVNLRAGALPAAIEVAQEQMVEASLGADSIRHGLGAAAAGLTAVVATMLLYYRWAGVNATLALVLNGVLLIAALACFGAVLDTAPESPARFLPSAWRWIAMC